MIELLIRRGGAQFVIWCAAGHLGLQSISIQWRVPHGGGGPGIDIPPDRIVDTGIYAYTRNPMYLGRIIFMLGPAIMFCSIPAVLLLVFHVFWLQRPVLEDEVHLRAAFGEACLYYVARVKRWIPGEI